MTVDKVLDKIIKDLVPTRVSLTVALMDDTEGMPESAKIKFEEALKAASDNFPAACVQWDKLHDDNIEHVSLDYNQGVCRELEGKLDEALSLYQKADALKPGDSDIKTSLNRINEIKTANTKLKDQM